MKNLDISDLELIKKALEYYENTINPFDSVSSTLDKINELILENINNNGERG